MANIIRVKRSAVEGKVPLTTDLQLGEFAVNTFDGKLYIKKDNGTESIVVIGAPSSGSSFLTYNPETGQFNLTTASADTASTIVVRDANKEFGITGINFTTNDVDNATPRKISWNKDNATFDMQMYGGVTYQAGQELYFRGRAVENIANGDVVMFAGVQGDQILFAKADISAPGFIDEWVVGIATQEILENEFGYVTWFGKVKEINTFGFTAGSLLYLSPTTPGALTATEPTSPTHKILLAAVLKVSTNSSSNDGIILVRPSFKFFLDELHDVVITNPQNNQYIGFNGSLGVWENKTGAIGFTGSQGTTGFTGSQGVIGFTGSHGNVGFTGSQGTTGFTGSQGTTGFTGSQGTQGVTGFTGSQGVQGVTGFTGSVGFTGSQGTGFTGSGFSAWTLITSETTLVRFNRYAISTSAGSYSVTLPASPSSGDWLIITDAANWGTNNLTVLRNGSTIEGIADDLLIDVGNITVEFTFVNSTWQVVASIGAKGDTGFTGSVGFTGSQGVGFTGSRGTTGFTGSQGVTGFTGSQGVQGVTGFTGSSAVITYTNGADNRVLTSTSTTGITAETNLTYDGSTLNLTDGTLQRPVICDYGETLSTPAISANAVTLNLENGNVFRVTLNANINTLTISNPPASGTAGSFTLILNITGTFTVNWPASVKWANGTAPTLSTTNGKRDIFTFMTTDGGTEWFGFAAGTNF